MDIEYQNADLWGLWGGGGANAPRAPPLVTGLKDACRICDLKAYPLAPLRERRFGNSAQGTGHYLIGGEEDFRGDHLIFERTKGGISRN